MTSIVNRDNVISPPVQEVEFALLLQNIITTLEKDPAQLRRTVYDFARTKLKNDISWADEDEKTRLLTALETAIQGVEQFSTRPESMRLGMPSQPAKITHNVSAMVPQQTPVFTHAAVDSVIHVDGPYRRSRASQEPLFILPRARSVAASLLSAMIGIVVVAAVGGGVYLQRNYIAQHTVSISPPSGPIDVKVVSAPPNPLPYPIPSVYGIYALNRGNLSELEALPQQVPDKRVAMSTPVTKASRTTLPDGKVDFIAFRRDLAGNAPERVDVRVVAQVMRELSFDPKGKAAILPVTEAWNIRNVSYEFRVKPVPGNPEMVLIQPENPGFELTPGRYVLALNGRGYDFTVPGKVSDAAHCLERTEAANGTFYSDCEKP
jgi:hypothetical protein